MKYEIYTEDFPPFSCPEIIQLTDLSLYNFNSAIGEFHKQVKWSDMWNYEEANNRLKQDWKLLTFTPEYNTLGWFWLNVRNQSVHNLWIHSDWRNEGWGTRMYLAITNLAKELKIGYLQTYVDDWNVAGQRVAEKAGWKLVL